LKNLENEKGIFALAREREREREREEVKSLDKESYKG